REGEEPGDRADENDAARVTAEEREERLRDGDLADHVDLELAAQLFGREELERAGDRDPGVVDEPRESGAALALRDAVRRPGDRVGIRHIQTDRGEPVRRLAPERLAILRPAHAGVDPEPGAVQPERRRPTD